MAVKQKPTMSTQLGVSRLSTARDIIYKAYSRPYAGGGGQVLNLFASCSYPTGNSNISFEGDGKGNYKLMEQVPGIIYHIITYYVASFTTGVGLTDPGAFVTIIDAHGEHKVPVEAM